MPRTIRFHLDEHADLAIADGLRRRGIDVTTTQDVGLTSSPDVSHLEFIRTEGRVLFTEDADFLRTHASGQLHTGIVYCHQQTRSVGEIIRGLVLIWEVLEPEEMQNRVEYL